MLRPRHRGEETHSCPVGVSFGNRGCGHTGTAGLFDTLLDSAEFDLGGATPGSRTISPCSAQNIVIYIFFCAWSEMMKVKLPHSLALRGGYDPGGRSAALRGEITGRGREQKAPGSSDGCLPSIPDFPSCSSSERRSHKHTNAGREGPMMPNPIPRGRSAEKPGPWVPRLRRGLSPRPLRLLTPVAFLLCIPAAGIHHKKFIPGG